MLRLSHETALAIALHAIDQSWIVFAQISPPTGNTGPIKIEGVNAKALVPRMKAISSDNAYEVFLIGLIPTQMPLEVAGMLYQQFSEEHLHDGWFQPSANLLGYVEETATYPMMGLLAQTHPGGLSDGSAVDIKTMAAMLGVSVPTVRRMVAGEEIPYLRVGKILRFVPDDVFASLAYQGRAT